MGTLHSIRPALRDQLLRSVALGKPGLDALMRQRSESRRVQRIPAKERVTLETAQQRNGAGRCACCSLTLRPFGLRPKLGIGWVEGRIVLCCGECA